MRSSESQTAGLSPKAIHENCPGVRCERLAHLRPGACLVLLGRCLGLLLVPLAVSGQSYSIDWLTIDGGVYSVSGTIGQSDAGTTTGGQLFAHWRLLEPGGRRPNLRRAASLGHAHEHEHRGGVVAGIGNRLAVAGYDKPSCHWEHLDRLHLHYQRAELYLHRVAARREEVLPAEATMMYQAVGR
jgi:hypothetical protein